MRFLIALRSNCYLELPLRSTWLRVTEKKSQKVDDDIEAGFI